MGQEFEDQDLGESVFWGVNLKKAHFRDVNFTGTTMFHVSVKDVSIDGEIDGLVVNGVDVTDFVNEGDRWYPLRSMLTPGDSAGATKAWRLLEERWSEALTQADALTDEQRRQSVGGEWSFIETLRHLVMAMDKWFTLPVLGHTEMHPFILPNRGSNEFDWPGRDATADPTYDEVLAVRAQRAATFGEFIASVTPGELARTTIVLENGEATVEQCLHVVFEEEFEHLRYALRDLELLV
ncbi:MAG: DinB family protein [Ilumatobacteraceae bacterium]